MWSSLFFVRGEGVGHTLRVAVVGGSGYTGVELLRLLVGHPGVSLTLVTSESYAGRAVAEAFPHLTGLLPLTYRKLDAAEVARSADVAFLALPHKVSMTVGADLVHRGMRVVDLSADFRLRDPAVYAEWYGTVHVAGDLLPKAVYGLPEVYRREIAGASLVATPGCYPTGALLGLLPLIRAQSVDLDSIVVDAISGTSGAGRKLDLPLHFSECDENLKAYQVARHRHTPEIEQELSRWAGREVTISFTPHLAPAIRGILSTLYATLLTTRTVTQLHELYQGQYRAEPFVSVLPEGSLPETKQVVGSNRCLVGLSVDPRTRRVIVVTALDNLVKGAAGAAVQCMNLMAGLDETTGLRLPALFP